ncbi:MAG: nucleotide sugar dehydrogenase [Planctomycetes bacterium]|nr:nucleotide sugar dehydrogenase [Planctomycetota bacterium]MBM4083491.1 nucleotide sugar dehydrogenase [Planctomycetota bacterium]
MSQLETLHQRITSREAVVGIIGLGYVGLPLVREFCHAGFRVTGFDTDPVKVDALRAGRSYIKHIPSDLVQSLVGGGKFHPTADFAELRNVDAIIICVPTPLTKTKDPDLSYIAKTADSIAQNLRRGHLVVLESTTYPGTTEEVVLPRLDATGLKCGQDYYLAFSPEREDPGNPKFSTHTIPKVVGGVEPASAKLAQALYGQVVVKVVPVSSAAVAEATKILENIYRCVNIALVNELKMLFDKMGIDVWEVIAAASTKPFGFQPFYPGPGLGGHCIPIDPFYLSWKAKQYGVPTRFIELAGQVNSAMPEYVIARLTNALNERGRPVKGSRVLVLGVAYKRDVDDMRESPALEIIEHLKALGAEVTYSDPHIPKIPPMRAHHLEMAAQPLTPDFLRQQDCVLIVTDHTSYDYAWIVANSALVVDTRNATKGVTVGREKIVKA